MMQLAVIYYACLLVALAAHCRENDTLTLCDLIRIPILTLFFMIWVPLGGMIFVAFLLQPLIVIEGVGIIIAAAAIVIAATVAIQNVLTRLNVCRVLWRKQ